MAGQTKRQNEVREGEEAATAEAKAAAESVAEAATAAEPAAAEDQAHSGNNNVLTASQFRARAQVAGAGSGASSSNSVGRSRSRSGGLTEYSTNQVRAAKKILDILGQSGTALTCSAYLLLRI